MTHADANAAILRRAYEAWSQSRGRDIETWLELCSPDIVLRSIAEEHEEGRFQRVPAGVDGVRQYLTDLLATWIMERHEVERIIADGDEVAVVVRAAWRHRFTNKPVVCPLVDIWTFKDGKAVSLLEVFDSAAMVAAATPEAA